MGSGLPAGSSGHAPGTVVGRRYRLEAVIGVGGMGVVHRATDQIMRRTVAVKEVRMPTGSPAANADARERVLREARSAGRIHHPGAVGVLDVIDDGELPWIVMELVEGEPLSARIEREGGLPVDEVAQIGISLAYALDAAHRLGVVHRDVKPSNVLLTQDGQARLTDFGIAVSNGDPRLTRTGEVVGSPAYLAPERAHGEPGGPECDVWGLGATLYAAVEGEPPFGGATPLDILTSVVEGLIRPPRHAGRLGPLLDGMLSQRELDRPTLTSVRTRLRDLAGETPGRPSAASQTRTTPRPTGPPPRRPATSSPGRAPSAPPATPRAATARPATARPATPPPPPAASRPATPATPRPATPSPATPVTPQPVKPTTAEPVTASAAGAPPAAPPRAAGAGRPAGAGPPPGGEAAPPRARPGLGGPAPRRRRPTARR
ncbi:serine/threonine-protein kinase [Frankia sp. AgW1.1]|uniref:serine/threonine-protein kinase n=1 Tax=Frankia sp. AgW1.1 TaxID=1836971 RepID=UPI0019344E1D|nr:serine/threonine-protein kinase [Frankia sp. AgW1.1]MBL7492860.1 serine/threonine protein kinase [Frankia sp. AgW1.1]